MNTELKNVYEKYQEGWQLLYDLLEVIPADKFDWGHDGNRTLHEQFAHIIMVQNCYMEVVRQGAEGWKECHVEESWTKKSQKELLETYKKLDGEMKLLLESMKGDEQIDWKNGNYKSFLEHLQDLVDHQTFHQGQLVVYIRSLGLEIFPDSWSVWGY